MSDENTEEKSSKKKDKEKRRIDFSDQGTPDPIDENFTKWVWRVLKEKERAQHIHITQLFGTKRPVEGSCIMRVPIRTGDPAISPEEVVQISNQIYEEMRNEANIFRAPRRFIVVAIHNQKGGTYDTRMVEVEPNKALARVSEGGLAMTGIPELDDENPLHLSGTDALLNRFAVMAKDHQWHEENLMSAIGGTMKILVDQNTELHTRVMDLSGALMTALKDKTVAEDHALDRELIREERRFVLNAKERGMNLVAGLLPGLASKLTRDNKKNGKSNSTSNGDNGSNSASAAEVQQEPAPERTTESIQIEAVMAGLSAAEKKAVFGVWTDEGERVVAGILSEDQVKLIVGVLRGEQGGDAIDLLIRKDSKIRVTDEQLFAVTQAAQIEKLVPLLEVINDHKKALGQE